MSAIEPKTMEPSAFGQTCKLKYDSQDVAVTALNPKINGFNQMSLNELNTYNVLKGCPYLIQYLYIVYGSGPIDNSLIKIVPHSIKIVHNYCQLITIPVEQRLRYLPVFLTQMVTALQYLNSKGIIHNNIELKHIFTKDGIFNLGHFKYALQAACIQTKSSKNDVVKLPSSINTTAPEHIINQSCNKKTDIWLLGKTIIDFIVGRVTRRENYTNYEEDHAPVVKLLKGSQVTNEVIKLLEQMLTFDVKDRIDVDELFAKVRKMYPDISILMPFDNPPQHLSDINHLTEYYDDGQSLTWAKQDELTRNNSLRLYYSLITDTLDDVSRANLKVSQVVNFLDCFSRYVCSIPTKSFIVGRNDIFQNFYDMFFIAYHLFLKFIGFKISAAEEEAKEKWIQDVMISKQNLTVKGVIQETETYYLKQVMGNLANCETDQLSKRFKTLAEFNIFFDYLMANNTNYFIMSIAELVQLHKYKF